MTAITIEINSYLLVVATVFVLLLTIAWLWWSKKKQEGRIALLLQTNSRKSKSQAKQKIQEVAAKEDISEDFSESDDENNKCTQEETTPSASSRSKLANYPHMHSHKGEDPINDDSRSFSMDGRMINNSAGISSVYPLNSVPPQNQHRPAFNQSGLPIGQTPNLDQPTGSPWQHYQQISLGNTANSMSTGYTTPGSNPVFSQIPQQPIHGMYGQLQYQECASTTFGPPPIPQQLSMQEILKTSTLISDGSPKIYKIEKRTVSTTNKGIEKCEINTPHLHQSKPTRVLMVVGATGAGKSTLINGIVNYLLGIKWEDDVRFKLIADEVNKSQAHSQTQIITSYTLYWQEGCPLDYNLTIIDTPGFGDTRGLARDRAIIDQIREFFSVRGDKGIDQIHGVGFVTQASLARLTPTQKYVFDSILSVFGKDIEKNIFIMTTFADGGKPAVMGAIEEARVPYCKFFPFNNSALFESNTNKFTQMFWNMGYESFKDFFAFFERAEAVSLQLTRDVLKERQSLETLVVGLQKRINTGISKIEQLQQVEKTLKTHEAEIIRSKNFRISVKVPKHRQVPTKTGKYVTNCLKCNFTCHENCIYGEDEDKYKCSAMNGGDQSNAACRICPKHCVWQQHRNNSYYFEAYEETEIQTLDELRQKYDDASSKKVDVQRIISNIEKELQDLYKQVLFDIQQVRQCLQRLDEIALKPNPLTDTEYIGLLIEAEKNEKKIGFEQRIKHLNHVKEQAELMAKAKNEKEFKQMAEEGGKALWTKFRK